MDRVGHGASGTKSRQMRFKKADLAQLLPNPPDPEWAESARFCGRLLSDLSSLREPTPFNTNLKFTFIKTTDEFLLLADDSSVGKYEWKLLGFK